MNVLFDLLGDKERRTLVRFGLAVVVALALFLAVFARFRVGLDKEKAASFRVHETTQKTLRSRDEAKAEWQRWEQAGKDLADLRTSTFYDLSLGIQPLRQDLQKIFAEAGTTVMDLSYSYTDQEKEKVRTTLITFTYSGTYAGLKRLLAVVQAFPKFLVIEKLEFPRTGSGGGGLSAKMTLAGYYGN
jgi:hypothetical protein